MPLSRITFTLLVSLWCVCGLRAQYVPPDWLAPDSATVYRFQLREGAVVIGRVVAATADSLQVASGSFTRYGIARAGITRVTRLDPNGRRFGRSWFPPPVPSRHLMLPSAIPMKKGEFRHTNTYIFFNAISAGITRNISASFGTETNSLLPDSAGRGPILFGSVRASMPVADGFHAGAYGLVLSMPFGGWIFSGPDRLNLGLAGAMATLGDENRQITLAAGWSVLDFSWVTRYPMVNLSGQYRFGKRFSFISENWVLPLLGRDAPYLLSYGVRVMGTRIAGDFAFLNSASVSRVFAPGIPYASFTFKW